VTAQRVGRSSAFRSWQPDIQVLQRLGGNRAVTRLLRPSATGAEPTSAQRSLTTSPRAVQRRVYFTDSDAAEQASAVRPPGSPIWVSNLISTDNRLYADGAAAVEGAKADIGVAGEHDHEGVGKGLPAAQKGTYRYWYGPGNTVVGVPTHTSDVTNVLYRVGPTGYAKTTSVVHSHGVTYGGDFEVLNNPGAPYVTHPAAQEHYLHKPELAAPTINHTHGIALDSKDGPKRAAADKAIDELLKK